jgi:hypothetical protein
MCCGWISVATLIRPRQDFLGPVGCARLAIKAQARQRISLILFLNRQLPNTVWGPNEEQ